MSIRGNDRAVWRRGFAESLTEECDDIALQSMQPAQLILKSIYSLAVQLIGSRRSGNYQRFRDKMGQRVIRTDFETQQKNKQRTEMKNKSEK